MTRRYDERVADRTRKPTGITAFRKIFRARMIRSANPHEDALRYVEWILRYRAKRQKKTRRKKSLVPSDGYVVESRSKKIEAIYDRRKPSKSKYLKGLDMWFILPGEPIADALIKYCYEKEIYWQEAVRDFLSKQLDEEGCL